MDVLKATMNYQTKPSAWWASENARTVAKRQDRVRLRPFVDIGRESYSLYQDTREPAA